MKKILTILGILVAVCAIVMTVFMFYTKSFSPREELVFKEKDVMISVKYCRPYRKGRKIFGGLVPYGKTWRTGANEATVFESRQQLFIHGKPLPPGKYSLWTVPYENYWIIIFNQEHGQWGIRPYDGRANHDTEKDVLRVRVPSHTPKKTFEQFVINLTRAGQSIELKLSWEDTQVILPMSLEVP